MKFLHRSSGVSYLLGVLFVQVLSFYHFVRSQSFLTRFIGPHYTRSRTRVEINLTYDCNLKCINCDRSCTQAPSDERITTLQIRQFIEESVIQRIRWQTIRMLGGEPTLHPDLMEILQLLLTYKLSVNPQVRLILVTNGYGEAVEATLARLPRGIEVENSQKDSRKQLFVPFNNAPTDSRLYRYSDYTSGCRFMSLVGMGLTPYGYYHCAVAGGIDRVFRLGVARKELPHRDDLLLDQMQVCCRLCGHFGCSLRTNKPKVSPTWRAGYLEYSKRRRQGV